MNRCLTLAFSVLILFYLGINSCSQAVPTQVCAGKDESSELKRQLVFIALTKPIIAHLFVNKRLDCDRTEL